MWRATIAWTMLGFLLAMGGPSELDSVQQLRSQGPEGLAKLIERHAAELARGARNDPSWKRLTERIDAVAAQKDAYASRLYWYTDLAEAQSAARRDGKPILSLRLLGRLDQDLSCANSRLFRTTLYPDPAVSKLMRERFILHWSSERPVPIATIDFGDGRVMKRPITGNSIHYVLDADAQPIDALPGLYSADEFVARLNQTLELSSALASLNSSERGAHLQQWHRGLVGKSDAVKPARLSAESVRLIANKQPTAERAGRLTVSKFSIEAPVLRALAPLQQRIDQDTALNETTLHRQIHQWFADGAVGGFDALNTRVYSELFLTPRSDPWLGLAPPEAFSALENDGLTPR